MRLVPVMDPILRTKTDDMTEAEIAESGDISSAMLVALRKHGGIGLAAPQVGIGKSIFVISIDGVDRVFINPRVLSAGQEMSTEEEGCLSIPGLRLRVTRPTTVKVSWIAEDGQPQVADLEGLWARCWLHEYDHLQGILIDDRVSKLALDMAKRKLIKKIKRISRGNS